MTSNLDQLRLQDSQRVDREDVEFLANSALSGSKELVQHFLLGHTQYAGDTGPGTEGRRKVMIVSGFKPELATPPGTNNQLKVVRGTALLGMRDPQTNQPSYGVVAGVGDDQKILDLSAYANGTYGVWLRFELVDGGFANRVFWDPLAVKEYTQNIATRRVANWGLTTVLGGGPTTSPGSEWTYLGDVVKSAGPLAVTPRRTLYFEGYEQNGLVPPFYLPLAYSPAWGSASDRNADRGTYGLQDLHSFVSATLQKLFEIQGTNWWLAPAESLSNKMSRNGDTSSGPYVFNGAVTHQSTTTLNGDVRGNGTANLGDATYKFNNMRLAGDAVVDGAGSFGTTLTVAGIINANGGIRTNGADDIGAAGGLFANIYSARSVIDAGTTTSGNNLELYGSNTGIGFQGITFKTTAVETTAVGLQWFEGGGLLGTAGFNFLSQRNSDSFSVAMKDSGGAAKILRFGNGDGSLKVQGAVIPWTDSTAPANGFPIGSGAFRWSYLYAQAAVIYTQIAAGSIGTVDIGASGNAFRHGFAETWNASTTVNVGTLGAAETWLTASQGRFGAGSVPPGGGYDYRFNSGVQMANAKILTGGVLQVENGAAIKTPRIEGVLGDQIYAWADNSAADLPIVEWQQDRQDGCFFRFSYNGAATPPSVGSPNPIGISDAIVARGPWGYALRVYINNGGTWVVAYIPAYYYDQLP